MILASQLRPGTVIRFERQLYKVLEVAVKAGGGQLGGVVKTRLQGVPQGRLWEQHFRPDERLEELPVERRAMEYLFSDSLGFTFMDPLNFEQVQLSRDLVGPTGHLLQAGTSVPVAFCRGEPISVVLPDSIEAAVRETAPPMHAGQESAWKDATLDNGMHIQVPLFVGVGEIVRVDLHTGRYVERVRLERKRGA
ncbi:MAG TPA: hypothetical protein VFU76_12385 [Terriglobales bacterium]|nr:hypothetical protein [Terriglobales bacterium]